MIKLEADVSRQIPAYGSSRCDFPLAHCDNLTDEIFAESDENFSFCSAAADPQRAINGFEAAVAVSAVVTPPLLFKNEPGELHTIHAEEERGRGVTAVKASGKLVKSSAVPSCEKVKRGRVGRPSSQPSLSAPSVPGEGFSAQQLYVIVSTG
jgi:hypothetical protein